MIFETLAKKSFYGIPGLFVYRAAPFDQQRIVGDLLSQRVFERILRSGDARLLVNSPSCRFVSNGSS